MKKQDRILLLSFAGIALLMLGIFFIMEHLQDTLPFLRLSRPPLHRLWLAGPSAAERRLYAQSGGSHHQQPANPCRIKKQNADRCFASVGVYCQPVRVTDIL